MYNNTSFIRFLLNMKVVKFLAVGGTATLIHFLLLIFLVEAINLNEVFASASAFIFSAIINYLLNFHFTFASNQKHKSTLPKFIVVAGFGFFTNIISFSITLTFIGNYVISQCIATLFVLTINYLLHRFWIYKEDII